MNKENGHEKFLDLDFGKILKIIEADFGDYRKTYEIEKYIKQSIRVACKFYLKYKDNPKLLMKERNEICPSYWENMDLNKYNDWLFKKTFKCVLNEKEEQ